MLLMGNTFMIMLIQVDPWLPTPMYFLLSQLSFRDTMLVLTIVPKMSPNYLIHNRSVSPAGCGTQIFLSLTLGGGECFLLAAKAHNHYVSMSPLGNTPSWWIRSSADFSRLLTFGRGGKADAGWCHIELPLLPVKKLTTSFVRHYHLFVLLVQTPLFF